MAEGASASALALLLIFGANAVLAISLWAHQRLAKRASSLYSALQTDDCDDVPAAAPKAHAKQLSEPLGLSLSSIRALSYELLRLSLVLLIPYICEKHPIFPHSKKVHDMDTFWCMVAMLVIACAMNVRRGKSTEVLNREQTEEWKGWMQFIFLLYHYFSAHEVYNSVRVMITSYVWMTGFGNFSFFYLKSDFGIVRLLQMLWRLNFLVLLLCASQGNTYILYYICPLHTFYFLLVYCIMRVWPSANYSAALRWKLLGAAACIYVVWDTDSGLFEKLFFYLGQTPKIGAGSGTMWEWYFRSSLDHWSTLLGMIFALNFPVTALWMKKVEALPFKQQWLIKGSVSAALLTAFSWWCVTILPQAKLDYNRSNAYYGVVIPLLTYIFLRNLSPTLRIHYVEPLHSIGKITLETYLMQHHVWLTSNAKTVLTLVPASPKLNLVATTLLYVLVSKELYRLTMSLRGMLLPDSKPACLKNLAGIGATVGAAGGLASALSTVGAASSAGVVAVAAFVLGLALTLGIHVALQRGEHVSTSISASSSPIINSSSSSSSSSSSVKEPYAGGLVSAKVLAPAVCAFLVLTGAAHSKLLRGYAGGSNRFKGEVLGPHDHCLASINHGMWEANVGGCGSSTAAYCESHAWRWLGIPDECHFHYLPPAEFRAAAAGKHIMFAGDSVQRFTYYAALRALGEHTPAAHDPSAEKHADLRWAASDGSGTVLSFLWAPLVADMVPKLQAVAEGATAAAAAAAATRSTAATAAAVSADGSTSAPEPSRDTTTVTTAAAASSTAAAAAAPNVLVMGLGLWDALHTHDLAAYTAGLEQVHTVLASPALAPALKVWITITSVVQSRLSSPEKQQWLTEPLVATYRQSAADSTLLRGMAAVLDGAGVTAQRTGDSYDGVHYSDFVYDAIAQLVANTCAHYGWAAPPSSGVSQSDGESPTSDNAKNAKPAAAAAAAAVKPAPSHKKIGSMADPLLGALVLLIAAIMLFTMDAYHGLALLALRLFGTAGSSSISWSEAYSPLLAKIGKGPGQLPRTATAATAAVATRSPNGNTALNGSSDSSISGSTVGTATAATASESQTSTPTFRGNGIELARRSGAP